MVKTSKYLVINYILDTIDVKNSLASSQNVIRSKINTQRNYKDFNTFND